MSELLGKVAEGMYKDKPLRIFRGTYSAPMDDPYFRDGRFVGQEATINVEFAVHPNNSGRIIVNIPGSNGEIDGYRGKYKILGRHIQSDGLGAVVRVGNHFSDGFLQDVNLRSVMRYVEEYAWEICGNPEPEILLMGFSAGASAIAARAHEYPEVTRILLGAPAKGMRGISVRDGISRFRGEVYIMIGDKDDNVGTDSGQVFYDWALDASKKELFVLPDCDHQFRGERNGRIISEAPFYAFSLGEKPKFPDPAGGIKLYD